MASLIKNQILKHLSKFTKNLSPDKIHLSTLKGEGEMSNLELDEAVLMELLDLPTWLRLSSATCNKVAIKIQWTKLKAQPICLYLDEIVVEMETCDKPRQPSVSSNLSSYSSGSAPPPDPQSSGGKYGFAERIIDGMFVSINSVIVNFKAPTFQASIQISRIIIQSKTPLWQNGDLRLTRIKDELRGEILIFKEAEWQTLRIEANALDVGDPTLATTPLRLIANQSKTRITIKKRLHDCGMVASRVQLNLDDLLWVLTDSQLKAAIVFVNSLKEVIQKSSQQAKLRATDKLKSQGPPAPNPQTRQQQQQQQQPARPQQGSKSQMAMAKLFTKYDVVETSYHLHTGRVDLHLCDDMAPVPKPTLIRLTYVTISAEPYDGSDSTPESGGRRRVEGGAMQITIHKMSLDHYPFHLAGVDRTHWVKHDENMLARNAWAQDLLNVFREEVRRVRETLTTPPPSPGAPPYPDQPPRGRQGKAHTGGRAGKTPPGRLSTKLLESCVVLRIEDFVLYRVSTAKDNKRNSPKKFLASDKKQLLLPPEMSSIHVEYTDYYFPEGIHFPEWPPPTTDDVTWDANTCCGFLPHANLFVVLNPLRLNLDWISLLWLNTFSLSLLQSLATLRTGPLEAAMRLVPPVLESLPGFTPSSPNKGKRELPEAEGPRIHTDIKIDALMPRIVLPSELLIKGQPDRPDSLQIQASKLTFTNCHIEHKASLPELGALLQTYENSHFFCNSKSDFPKRDEDFVAIPTVFRRHALKDNDTFLDSAIGDIVIGRRTAPLEVVPSETRASDGTTYYSMSTDSLKLDATKDVWCLSVDQFWMEFLGVPTAHGRPVAFVESFPLTLWLANPLLSRQPRPTGGHGGRNPHRPLERSGSNHLLKQYYGGDSERPPGYVNGDVGYPGPASRDGSPAGRAPRGRPSQDKACADMHLLLKVGAKVNVQLNHYQYVFLMRLVETVGKFSKDLAEDTAAILRGPPPEKTMVLAVKLKELELALVCPPIPEMPGGALESGSREDSDELKMLDDLPEEASRMVLNSRGDHVDDSTFGGRSNSLQTPAHILKSHSDTELTDQGYPGPPALSTSPGTDPRPRHPSTGEANYPRIQISDGSVTMSLGGQDMGSPYSSSPQHRIRSSENLHYDPDRDKKGGEIRKSFNNAFSNLSKLTEKVKQNVKALDVMDDMDDWDNLSLKSGASSDDEEFVFLKLHNATEVPAFERHHSSSESVSVADSDGKDESPGVNTFSGLADRARGVVSVVSFRLVNTEAIIQMKGDDMSVSSQVYHLIPHEYGNVNLDKFHQKFTAATKESEEQLPLVADPPLKLRYQVGPGAEALAPSAAQLGHLRAMVAGLRTKLCMSSVTNLVDLIEDEVVPPPMPMYITVSDCTFTLQNDGPPTHMTSPEPVPLDFNVDRLTLTRGTDGVFRVSTGPPRELDLPVHEGRQRSLSSTPPGVRGHDQRAVTPPGVRSYDGRPGTPPGVRAAFDQRPGTPPGALRGHDPRPGTPPGARGPPGYDRPSTPPGGRVGHDQRPGTPPGGRVGQDQRPLQEALRQIQGQATSLDRVKRENSALRDRIVQVEEELDHKLSQQVSKADYTALQDENSSLRRQLEKIASMDGGYYQQETLQREVHHWKEEAEAAEAVQRENAQLIQQLAHQQDEIHILKQERDSLLATLQLLQEELTASETMRSRGKPPLS